MERQAINTAIQNTGWVNRAHKTIINSLSPKGDYPGWAKRACWAQATIAGGQYFVEIHYNIDIVNNVSSDYKVKKWIDPKSSAGASKYPC